LILALATFYLPDNLRFGLSLFDSQNTFTKNTILAF